MFDTKITILIIIAWNILVSILFIIEKRKNGKDITKISHVIEDDQKPKINKQKVTV